MGPTYRVLAGRELGDSYPKLTLLQTSALLPFPPIRQTQLEAREQESQFI